MMRSFCAGVLLLVCGPAWGDPAGSDPADVDRPGTPSDATATVSPMTVSTAVDRLTPPLSPFSVSLGSSYASGHFGTPDRSSIWSSALGLRYATGTLRLSASLPYLDIHSAGTIFSGIDGTPVLVSTASPGVREKHDGLGDLTLGAAYTLETGTGTPEIEFSGRLKLPTARDSDHISSGKTDYSVGVEVTQVVGRLAPFVSATYRVFGDPSGFDLRNGFAASAGTSLQVTDRTFLLASYHFAERATKLVRDSHELFAGASTMIGQSKLRLTGFATLGLSSGAAGESGGLSLSVAF